MANTAISTTIYPKDVSLDDAYNLGSSITVDTSAITLTGAASDNTLYINQTGVLPAANYALRVYSNTAQVNSNYLVSFTTANASSTHGAFAVYNGGTGNTVLIEAGGVLAASKYAFHVYSNAIQVNSPLVRLEQDNASSTQGSLYIKNDGGVAAIIVQTAVYDTLQVINTSTQNCLYVNQNVSNATGKHGLYVYDNSAGGAVNTDGALVKIHESVAASTEPALEIVNDGTGYGIELNQVGIGYGLYAYSNAIMTATQLVRIHQQNASSTQPALMVIDTGTIDGVYFVQAGNGDALQIDSQGITTYAGINVNMAGTLTTGQAIYALSNSSTFSGTGLVQIIQDHASATGNCLYLRQDGSGQGLYIYSANVLAAGAHGIYVYSNSANTNGDTALIKVAQDNASCLEPCYYAYNGGAGPAIFTNQIAVSNASYPSIYFYSNAIQVNAPLVRILQNNSSSTKAALSVESNGTYSALIIGGTASSIQILEQAAANNDTAAYGQIWVKNDTPNKLYFTDDAGTDYPVAGSGIAATGAPKIQDVAVKYINSSASLASNTWTALSGGTGSTITFTLTVTSDVKLFLEIDYWNGSGLRQLKFRYNDGSTTFNETTITEDTPSGSTPYFNSYTLTSKAAGTYNISIEYFSGDGGNETFYMRGTNTAYIKVN